MRKMNRFLAILISVAVAVPVIFGALHIDKLFDTEGKVYEYTLGLGTVVNTDGAKTGSAAQTVTMAAVILDADGRVVDCVIDIADTKLDITDGKVSVGNAFLTKNELGDDYGMKAISPIGKEWYEQAAAFARFLRGKDAKAIEAIALDEGGKATDADLLAGCTIGVSDIKAAALKAVNDAIPVAFKAGDSVGVTLAAIVDDSASKPASAEAEGSAQMTVNICAAAVENAKVAGAIIDIAQPAFSFNGAGEITDKKFSGTKRELLDDYGMKAISPIGKEWYEQAEAFCDYIVGMSASDISAIGIGEAGKATDADLLAGCTVAVGDFVKIAAKAVGMARAEYTLALGTVVNTDEAKTGSAAQTVTMAAVILDSEGKVVDCVIDIADTKLDITDGKVTTGNTYLTKNELADDYGMKEYSPIGKEWYEQAAAFAEFCEGKTKAELEALSLDEGGKATDADLLAGCTIGIADFKAALLKALDDKCAKTFASDSLPALSLAVTVDDTSSKPASAEEAGKASMTVTVCAAALADEKAAGAVIDIAQPEFAFNGAGEITDKKFSGTKRELLEDYGMKEYSPIGKEWYEQADAFCDYIVGMTASDVSAIGVSDAGKATDADLLAGCTVGIGDFVKIAAKALSAK